MSSSGPTVSIVIPSRNRPVLVSRAVRAALSQRDVAMEVIVVDDGSDVPVAQVLAHQDVPDQHELIIVRNEHGSGVARARNKGIEAATGEWLGFCDDDDLWGPNKAASQIAACGDHADWSCSGVAIVDPSLRVIGVDRAERTGDVGSYMLERNAIPGGASSVIARTELVRELDGFDPTLSTLADWDLWARLGRSAALEAVNEPHMAYLVHPGSMSKDTALLKRDLALFTAKHAQWHRQFGVSQDIIRWNLYVGEMALRDGRRGTAAHHFGKVMAQRQFAAWRVSLAGIVSPQWAIRELDRRRASRVPTEWASRADAWLEPFRAGIGATIS